MKAVEARCFDGILQPSKFPFAVFVCLLWICTGGIRCGGNNTNAFLALRISQVCPSPLSPSLGSMNHSLKLARERPVEEGHHRPGASTAVRHKDIQRVRKIYKCYARGMQPVQTSYLVVNDFTTTDIQHQDSSHKFRCSTA